MEELEAIREAEEAAIIEAENAVQEAAALGSVFANIEQDDADSMLVRSDIDVRITFANFSDYRKQETCALFEDEDYEGPDFKSSCFENFKNVLDILCVWDCTRLWIRFSELLSFIVFDPFTELFITLCIVVNVAFLALDHYDVQYDGM